MSTYQPQYQPGHFDGQVYDQQSGWDVVGINMDFTAYLSTSPIITDDFAPSSLDTASSFTSEPLSRYASSEGSSQDISSTPASPLGFGSLPFQDVMSPSPPFLPFAPIGYEPMAFDLAANDHAAYDYARSQSVSPTNKPTGIMSIPRSTPVEHQLPLPKTSSPRSHTEARHSRDGPAVCLVAGCKSSFRRRADLDRHFKRKHLPDEKRDAFYCDYERCVRRREPFGRKDHLRDHLRTFHKEDIEKRGIVMDEEWFEGRSMPVHWWRCSKCLERVATASHGYECPTCNIGCQTRRMAARRH